MDTKQEAEIPKNPCKICCLPEGEMGSMICTKSNKKLLRKIYQCTGVRVTPSEGKIDPVCATCRQLINSFDENATPIFRDFVIEDQTSTKTLSYDPLCEVAPIEPIIDIVEPQVKITELPDPMNKHEIKTKKRPKIKTNSIIIKPEKEPTPNKNLKRNRELKPSDKSMQDEKEKELLPEIKSEDIKPEDDGTEVKGNSKINPENVEKDDSDWEWPLEEDQLEGSEEMKKKRKRGRKKKVDVTGPQKCEICDKIYSDIKRHMKTHNGIGGGYQCDHCERKFTQKSGLDYHIRTHTGERPYACDICGNAYYSSSHLRDHMISNHTTEKKFQCHICSKRFNLSFKLNMHLKTHSGLKPYDCEFCGKAFNKKNNRNVHVKRHMGIYSAICEICSKGFINKHCLAKHMKTHENLEGLRKQRGGRKSRFGPAPEGLTCDICQKTFDKKNLMRRHRQLHFDEHGNPRKVREKTKLVVDERTPFCDICSRPFASNKSLKDHRMKHFSGGDTHKRAYRAIEKVPLENLMPQVQEMEPKVTTTIVVKSEY